jgi:hypothetical protein
MYQALDESKFISSDTPYIFVNSETPEEGYGVSFTNKGEA